MKVLKFGGTSVGSAANIRKVKEIVAQQTDDIIVVVSALGGITDKILNAAKMAILGTDYFNTELTGIRERHEEMVDQLFDSARKEEVKDRVSALLDELERVVVGVSMIVLFSLHLHFLLLLFLLYRNSFISFYSS